MGRTNGGRGNPGTAKGGGRNRRRQVEWTREGFLEVGEILENILEEVKAFSELREITCGTVQANKESKSSRQRW